MGKVERKLGREIPRVGAHGVKDELLMIAAVVEIGLIMVVVGDVVVVVVVSVVVLDVELVLSLGRAGITISRAILTSCGEIEFCGKIWTILVNLILSKNSIDLGPIPGISLNPYLCNHWIVL